MTSLVKRILVVEDKPDERDLYTELLQRHGYQTIGCASAEDALNFMSHEPFDVVLMDYRLPYMDGVRATQEIRNRYKGTEVLVLTGQGKREEGFQAIRAGAFRYLYKQPETLNILPRLIECIPPLRELEQQLTQPHPERFWLLPLLNNAGAGVSIVDLSMSVLYMNEKQREISAPGATVGGICWVEYNQECQQRTPCPWCPVDRTFHEGKTARRTTRSLVRGQVRYFDVSTSPIRDSQGRIIAALEIVEDTTDREDRAELEKALGGTLNLDERLQTILERIREFGFDRARLYLLSPDERFLVGRAEIGGGIRGPFSQVRLPLAEDECARKVLSDKMLCSFTKSRNGQSEVCWQIDKTGIEKWVQVPLLVENKAIGMITADLRAGKPDITESQISRLDYYAKRAAHIVDLTRRFEEQQQRAQQLEALRKLDENLAGTLGTEEMCRYVIDAITHLTSAASAHLRVLEGEHPFERLVLRAGQGVYIIGAKPATPLNDADSGSVKCLQTGKPHIIVEAPKDRHFLQLLNSAAFTPTQRDLLRRIRSFGSFPMLLGGNGNSPIGTLNLQSENPDFFTPSVLALAQDVARRAALSIRNAQLFAQQQRRTKELEALRDVEQQLAKKEFQLTALLNEVVERLTQLTGAVSCVIFLRKGDWIVKKGCRGWICDRAPREIDLHLPTRGHLASVRAILEGKVQTHRAMDRSEYLEALRDVIGPCASSELETIRGWLSVPLLVDQEAIGAMTAFFGKEDDVTSDVISLVRDFALRVAVAVRNAQLIDEKSELRSIGHQLMMPLQNVRVYVKALLDGRERSKSERKDWLRLIHFENENFIRVVDDLRLLIQSDEQELEYRPGPIALRKFVKRLVPLFRLAARAKNIKITLNMQPRIGAVQADEHWLLQIMGNLLHNALRYSNSGTRIDIRVENTDRTVQIAVIDHGWGITDADRQHVCERGFRGSQARREYPEGRGIGLSVCKLLAERMGGTLCFESKEGCGSKFTLNLRKL